MNKMTITGRIVKLKNSLRRAKVVEDFVSVTLIVWLCDLLITLQFI